MSRNGMIIKLFSWGA